MLIFALILLSIFTTSITTIIILLIKKSKQKINFTPDFLLILGCRVKKDEVSKTLQSRVDAAAEFLKENENVIAFCCGGIVQPKQIKSEAAVMKDELVRQGIDQNRLILEDKSKTTQQNFLNAKGLLAEYALTKPPKLAFLSSDFHIFRAELIAKRAGLPCLGIAAKSPRQRKIKNYIREVVVMPFVFLRK